MAFLGIEKVFGSNKKEAKTNTKFEFSNNEEKRVFNEYFGANQLRAFNELLNSDDKEILLPLRTGKLKTANLSNGVIDRDTITLKRLANKNGLTFELLPLNGGDYYFSVIELSEQQKQLVESYLIEASTPTANTII